MIIYYYVLSCTPIFIKIHIFTLSSLFFSKFVRTPDIDEHGNFNGKFLSTRGDKVHCNVSTLENNADDCMAVDSATVEASEYRRHDPRLVV